MVTEAILNAISSLLQLIFGWINLPDLPPTFYEAIDWFIDKIQMGLGLVMWWFDWNYVVVILGLVLVVANFDKIYHFTMWLIKKLPFSID